MSTPTQQPDWLDRLWEHTDLAPAPVVVPDRTSGPACMGADPAVFAVAASPAPGTPSTAEQAALEICARCPVRSWCLTREMTDCTAASQVVGVRGGLRQADRRALYCALFGRRPRNGASK